MTKETVAETTNQRGFDRALEFIFGKEGCSEEFKTELRALVQKKLYSKNRTFESRSNVFILWEIQNDNNQQILNLLSKYNISLDRKEVILTKNYVLATDSYLKQPISLYVGPLF